MKKYSAAILTILTIFSIVVSVFSEGITVELNGNPITFPDAKPFIDQNDRTQIPLRAVSEQLGYIVIWDEKNQSVHIANDTNSCDFIINNPNVTVSAKIENGIDYGIVMTMDTVPIILNDRTYVPLRYMCETLNKNVEWDSNSQTVTITNSDTDISHKVYEAYQKDNVHRPYDHNDIEQITNIYTDNDIPSEWDSLLKVKAEKIYNAVNSVKIEYGGNYEIDKPVNMADGTYEIRINYEDEEQYVCFDGNLLNNLSEKALVEFIPDENTNIDSTFRINFRQGRANIDGEYTYYPAKQAPKIPTNKRSVFMVESIEKVPYIVTFDCFKNITKPFSGTVKIINFD